MAERKAMEVIDKELQIQIVNIKSEIEKQKDIVNGLKDHGEFLLGLSPPAWVNEIKNQRAKALEQFKRQWIKTHKEDGRDDHIIFRGDDPVVFSANALKQQAALLSPHSTMPL